MSKPLKLSNGRRIKLNTPQEEAAIQAGITADDDTYEPTDEAFRAMRKIGRPKTATPKVRITIRLSPDVVARFRASGPGWQTRMDAALQDWLKDHTPNSL